MSQVTDERLSEWRLSQMLEYPLSNVSGVDIKLMAREILRLRTAPSPDAMRDEQYVICGWGKGHISHTDCGMEYDEEIVPGRDCPAGDGWGPVYRKVATPQPAPSAAVESDANELIERLHKVETYFACDADYPSYEKHSPTIRAAIAALSPVSPDIARDAARYRYLRTGEYRAIAAPTGSMQDGRQPHVVMLMPGVHPVRIVLCGESLDAAIDSQLAREGV